jgi:iron complex transport system substrate-binding protein
MKHGIKGPPPAALPPAALLPAARLPGLLSAVLLLAVLLPAALSPAACAPRNGAAGEAAKGRAPAPESVRRIVSLSPGVTEILFALGAGELVVGVTQYCDYPPEARTRTKVGGFSGAQISVEGIAALRPDLVILSEDMHFRIRAMLDDLGIATQAVEPRNFDGVYKLIDELGRLCGFEERAAEITGEMREKIRRAGEQAAGREAPPVYWELSPEPLISVGGAAFISEAIRLGGGRNIFENLTQDYPEVSAEQVLLLRPQWIFTGDDQGSASDPAVFSRRPGWADIPAVREGQIRRINADRLYRYGPRLADAVLEIAGILHPGD